MPVSFSKVKVAQDARAQVDQVLARVSRSDAGKVKEALAGVAGQDANRFLTLAEAKAVVDAFERVTGATSGTVTGQQLTAVLDEARATAAAMASSSNVDGISTHFTFQERLTAKVVTELNDAVTRAHGRPLDVNMMIFEFQSDDIERAIVDLAKKNPNVTFRIVADSGQASKTGGNALPVILEKGLPNVQVKFKKDFPYVWNEEKKLPVYNHGATSGLNHHKGFATFIDGMPDRLVTGSFNWSDTADTKNYEDMTVFCNADASSRRAVEQYGDEFAGFFNNDDACLSPGAFSNFKRAKWNDMMGAHGCRPVPFTPVADTGYPPYVPAPDERSFDLNGFRSRDRARMEDLLGATLAKRILAERSAAGRYGSLEELTARVPEVGLLPAEQLRGLTEAGFFGSHTVSVNNATVEELDHCGFSKPMAEAVVAYREHHGDFESVEDLLKVPNMTEGRLRNARAYLSAVDVEGFFNSRPWGAAAGGTGYGSGSTRTTPVMGADGVVTASPASVTAGAVDLFNRAQPGQSICVAMYGMSTTAPECKALVAAARRGVGVKVILNDAFTASTVNMLKGLKAQGAPVDVRVQYAKTMHEKFGVVGNDVFSGSANFSESSSTKHSEDRFTVKNSDEMAAAFRARFDDMWHKSREV